MLCNLIERKELQATALVFEGNIQDEDIRKRCLKKGIEILYRGRFPYHCEFLILGSYYFNTYTYQLMFVCYNNPYNFPS